MTQTASAILKGLNPYAGRSAENQLGTEQLQQLNAENQSVASEVH